MWSLASHSASLASFNDLTYWATYSRSVLIPLAVAAYGFPSDLPLQSGRPADVAKVCNLLYAMLHQRQRDIERHRDTEDGMARLDSSLQIAEQARQRLEARLLAKDKEIGSLENKVRHVITHRDYHCQFLLPLQFTEATLLITEPHSVDMSSMICFTSICKCCGALACWPVVL